MHQFVSRPVFFKRNLTVGTEETLEVLLARLIEDMPVGKLRQWIEIEADKEQPDAARSTTLLSWLRQIQVEDRRGKPTGHTLLCGHMFRYTPGVNAPVYDHSQDGIEINLESLRALLPATKSTLECQAMFGVRGNHVVVVPGGALNAGIVNIYLQWLLEKAKVLVAGQAIRFEDYIPDKYRARLKGVNHVRMQFPFSVADKIAFDPPADGKTPHWMANVLAAGIKGITQASLGDLSAKDAATLQDVQVGLDLKLSSRSARSNADTIKDIVSSIPDDMAKYMRLELPGASIVGEDLKLHKTISFKYVEDIPLDRDVARKLFDYLQKLEGTGDVSQEK